MRLLRLLGTKRLIVQATRPDATDVAEEIKYLAAISDNTGVKCLLSIQNIRAFDDLEIFG